MIKKIYVVGAVIEDEDNNILCAQHLTIKFSAEMGIPAVKLKKVAPAQALKRELIER